MSPTVWSLHTRASIQLHPQTTATQGKVLCASDHQPIKFCLQADKSAHLHTLLQGGDMVHVNPHVFNSPDFQRAQ